MKSLLADIAGGAVLMVVATAVGIAHNAIRANPVALVQGVSPVSTARHDRAADATANTPTSTGDLPEGAIGVAALKRLVDDDAAVLIDARSPGAYDEGHIPGAINVPYDDLPNYLETMTGAASMDEHVVCYCWGPDCDFSDQLATELKIMGYERVSVFTGGWEQWTDAGYPAERTAGE